MKVIYVLLLALPLLAHANNKQVKLRKKPTKPALNCKKITCPAVEEPICVKIKFKREDLKNVTNYILMINKCELNYMKCHQHVEAAIVPMKFCDHSHISKTDKPKLSGRKRVKRTAQYEPNIDKNYKAKKPDANNKVVPKKGVRKNNRPSFKARTVKPAGKLVKLRSRSDKTVKKNKGEMFTTNMFTSKMFEDDFFGHGTNPKKGGEMFPKNMFNKDMFNKDMFNKNIFAKHLRQRGQRTKQGKQYLRRQGTVPNDGGYREKLIVKKGAANKGRVILGPGFYPGPIYPRETAPSNGNQALNDQTAPNNGGNRYKFQKEDGKKNMFDPNFFDMNSDRQKTGGPNEVVVNQETTPSNGNPAVNDQGSAPNDGGNRNKHQKDGVETTTNMFGKANNMFKGNMFNPDFFHMKGDSEETTTNNNNQVLNNVETSSNYVISDKHQLVKGTMHDDKMLNDDNFVLSNDKNAASSEASSDENPNDKQNDNAEDSEPQFGSPEANDHHSKDKEVGETQPPSSESEAATQPPSSESSEAETHPPNSESSEAETQPSTNNDAKTEPPSTEDAPAHKEDGNNQEDSSEEVSEGIVLEGQPSNRPGGTSTSEQENDENVNQPSDSGPVSPAPTTTRPQDNENCPTSCPSRAVMVCGRCQHGVYRTFLSVCQMRMFNCKHNDESMQLISHYPCVASAPFLSSSNGMNLNPEGKESVPGDQDQILRFIHCRSKGLVGEPVNVEGDQVEVTGNDLKKKCVYDNQRLKYDYASYGQ